ncbi:unnamed protein product [marine sediment metagenome]|uniref:Uncharacterized protein n=1 Tax=marine sediment metagenome TaxID=412755 RepID=X0WKW6_9ZZZZ
MAKEFPIEDHRFAQLRSSLPYMMARAVAAGMNEGDVRAAVCELATQADLPPLERTDKPRREL